MLPLPARRWITPWRVAAVLVVLLVAATAYWTHRQSARSTAEVDFVHHLEQGKAAHHAGDYFRAAGELKQALQAAEILGREDGTVRQARQMWRECRAMSDLSPQPLFEILAEARRQSRFSPAGWQKEFQQKYAERWLVFDTTVRQRHRPDSRGPEIVIDYPLLVGKAPLILDGDFPVLQRLSLSGKPLRVVLAVQLKSCEKSGEGEAGWVVRFHRDSAFLWSDYENLRRLGLAAPEEEGTLPGNNSERKLRAVLQRQNRWLHLPE